jgi:uncharacterized membrane protein YfhO
VTALGPARVAAQPRCLFEAMLNVFASPPLHLSGLHKKFHKRRCAVYVISLSRIKSTA